MNWNSYVKIKRFYQLSGRTKSKVGFSTDSPYVSSSSIILSIQVVNLYILVEKLWTLDLTLFVCFRISHTSTPSLFKDLTFVFRFLADSSLHCYYEKVLFFTKYSSIKFVGPFPLALKMTLTFRPLLKVQLSCNWRLFIFIDFFIRKLQKKHKSILLYSSILNFYDWLSVLGLSVVFPERLTGTCSMNLSRRSTQSATIVGIVKGSINNQIN